MTFNRISSWRIMLATSLSGSFALTLRLPRSSFGLFHRRMMCSLPSLTTTSSGLMYRDIHIPEDGELAANGSTVSVDYTGRLEDGNVFDSSSGRGPIQFRLGGREVIKGWDEGIRDMKVGGRRQLVIPPHLAYGARGAPPAIPPNALLHFDVELVAVGDQSWFGRLVALAKMLPIK